MYVPESPEEIIEVLQQKSGRTLSDDEQNEISLWTLGNELRGVVCTKGWQVAMQMLEDYVAGAQKQLIGMAPGDERVLVAHAAASALTDQLNKFKEDIAAAIQAADQYPMSFVAILPKKQDYGE